MARVMGVGVGLFLIAFVWAICIFLCLVLTRASTNISCLLESRWQNSSVAPLSSLNTSDLITFYNTSLQDLLDKHAPLTIKLGPVLILVAGLFTIILVVIPRDPQFPTEDEQAVVYDYSIIYRSVIIAVLSLFILIGLVMYLIKHAMEPVYAKRLRRLRA